jgi:hypothetical protein
MTKKIIELDELKRIMAVQKNRKRKMKLSLLPENIQKVIQIHLH